MSQAQPSSGDCVGYAPASLQVVEYGSAGWLLRSGTSQLALLDHATDAQRALALAQRHTAQCCIGRDNRRPKRANYIITYWR